MRTLQLKELAAYAAYGLVIYHYNYEWDEVELCHIEILHVPDEVTITDGMSEYDIKLEDVKPLLIPLSELTDGQWIEVFKAGFKGVFTHEHVYLGELQHIYRHANAIEMVCPGFSVNFDFNNLQFGTEPYAFSQLSAFSKIYELHADLHFLIEAGLALNKLEYIK